MIFIKKNNSIQEDIYNMLRKQWQDYALKAKQIAKHIITGLEQNKKGIRLVHIVYGLDMYATDALNLKYSKQRSKSSVHTYQGGKTRNIYTTCRWKRRIVQV